MAAQTSEAMKNLRELIRLKKLKGAISQIEGPNASQLVNQKTHEINKLSEKIAEITEEMIGEEGFGKEVPYNEAQQRFIDLLVAGNPIALTGPAGSGKTTAVKGGIRKLLQTGSIPPMSDILHNYLNSGTPGVVCTAFTNKAVENMKRVLPKDLRSNCITIHKLLEFQPEYFETEDPETGTMKKTMQFLPKRSADNPLPKCIKVLFIDEATMVSVDLWNLLADAIQHPIQIVLIGDIQQLPPVFGKSIFIHAMQAGVEKVELTEVHRQALESPIISLAHRILSGKQIPAMELDKMNYDGEHGKLLIKPWKKKLGDTAALKAMGMFLPEFIDAGAYNPMEDVILTCFNVNFGCIELNKIVAGHLATKARKEYAELLVRIDEGGNDGGDVYEAECFHEKTLVHEIIAGINKKYFRIGDKVLYNKTEHFITGIEKNPKYFGKLPRMPSTSMDYNGIESDPSKAFTEDAGNLLDKSFDEIDDFLNSFQDFDLGEEEKGLPRAASHKLKLFSPSLDTEVTLESGGEIGNLELGYAITVHKSQGSEYPRVFFITHETQANMHFRELLYTGVTRAKRELIVICPPNLFLKGINSQRLPGKTLEDKLIAFDRTIKLQKGAVDQTPMRLDLFTERKAA